MRKTLYHIRLVSETYNKNHSAAGLRLSAVVKDKDRFEAEWLLASAWSPSVGYDVIDSTVYHWTSRSSLSYNQAFVPGFMFGSMSCKAHQAHIALSEPITSIVQQGSSFGLIPASPFFNPHYSQPLCLWLCGKLCLVEGRDKYPLGKNLLPFPAAWGLCSHHQTKLPNLGSASLPPAEAEDVESNQSQQRIQHSLPDQPQLPFLVQTALLIANLRKSYNQTAFLRVFWDHFWFLTTPFWQIPWGDDAVASTNCIPAPA